ncbi:hypothetical protein CCR97_02920 [Rhodoplanes elegans]|nr:hypothetical protein [Rhodoplanes elegans]
MFSRLKDFRRVATRYDKLARNFLAGAILAATVAWWLNQVLTLGRRQRPRGVGRPGEDKRSNGDAGRAQHLEPRQTGEQADANAREPEGHPARARRSMCHDGAMPPRQIPL